MGLQTKKKLIIPSGNSQNTSNSCLSVIEKTEVRHLFRFDRNNSMKFSMLVPIMIGFVGLTSVPSMVGAEILNTTAFEWSMPDRLLENTGIAGYDPATPIPQYDPDAQMLPTGGWTVNFNACDVTTSTVSAYNWYVDGVAVGSSANCDFSHQFAKEDTYQVTLELTDDVGGTVLVEQEITVQDWLIVALGESYASGEGNPDKPVTVQAQIDFHILSELVNNIEADLQNARDLLPGKQEAQQAALQLKNDAQSALDQAIIDLTRLEQDAAELIVIDTNVENDPAVVVARNNVASKVVNLSNKQTDYDTALSVYNNCEIVLFVETCLGEFSDLAAAKLLLDDAELALLLARAALVTVHNTAIVIYTASATIGEFTLYDAYVLARDTKLLAVNVARSTRDTAQNAFNNAYAAWQQTVAAVASLESLIIDTQSAWDEARLEAKTQYLNHLPVWTSTAPSWGTPEPSYADIVLNGEVPGDALRCHRSMISGQARAALAIEQADPHTSVTLIHLACSGAVIDNLIKDSGENYKMITQENPGVLDPLLALTADITIPAQMQMKGQIAEAAAKTLNREVDAVVISIGGNDVGFGDLIVECILGEPCHLDDDTLQTPEYLDALHLAAQQNCSPGAFINFLTGLSLPTGDLSFSNECLQAYDVVQNNVLRTPGAAKTTFDANLISLDAAWTKLDTEIAAQFPTLERQRVYLTDYPDATGDDFGNYCGWNPMQSTIIGEELKNLPGVTQPEMIWADTYAAAGLRNSILVAANQYQWSFIQETGLNGETISSASRNHGYCADDHWVATIPESLITQQDTHGIMHPNRKGHANYQQAIYTQLIADFYPNGVTRLPTVTADIPGSSDGTGNASSGSVNPMLLMGIIGMLLGFRQYRYKL